MRILRLIPSAKPESGGPIEGVRQITPILNRDGHQTEIVSLDDPRELGDGAIGAAVHALGPGLGKYGLAWRLMPWLEQNAARFDCAVIHGMWQFTSFGSWLVLRRRQLPFFVYTHGMIDPWFRETYPLKHLKKLPYWLFAERWVLRNARAVLFTAEDERQLAAKSFPFSTWNGVVVSYGTGGVPADVAADRQALVARFPLLADKRIVLTVGRIHPIKGYDLLIAAFAKIAGVDPALHLVIAGPDEVGLQAELERQARALGIGDRVTFTGLLSGAIKWAAFRSAEVFASPSHHENFGIAVVEALSCGVPVLISNQVKIWREIAADQAGFVADDTVAGTESLLRSWLAQTPESRAAMSHNALDSFRRRFRIEQVAQGFVATLREHGVAG